LSDIFFAQGGNFFWPHGYLSLAHLIRMVRFRRQTHLHQHPLNVLGEFPGLIQVAIISGKQPGILCEKFITQTPVSDEKIVRKKLIQLIKLTQLLLQDLLERQI